MLSAKIFAAFLFSRAGKIERNLEKAGVFVRFSIFSAVFAENSPFPVRQFPYCVGWFPYSVGGRNKEVSQQPYCIGAQEGGAVRSLSFVRGFVAFVGGEKWEFR